MVQVRRVVVTGLGAITPVGLSAEESWTNILAAKSGIRAIASFDTQSFPVRIGASVVGFDPSLYLPQREVRRFDPFIHYGVAAALQASEDAQLNQAHIDKRRVGVAIGSAFGGLGTLIENFEALQEGGTRKVVPFLIPGFIVNMLPGYISIRLGFEGPNFSIVSACSTATHNIGYAARIIAYGDVDIMLAGGSESFTIPIGVSGFAALQSLSQRNDEPERASRPWDRDRDGFVMGEGAGVVVLEAYEHAKQRNARIYAELSGFGATSDAYHTVAPDSEGRGASAAMNAALEDARLASSQIDYINAHATSTPVGDRVELKAIEKTFGNKAHNIAISSTKGVTGHLLGAAGAIEAIFCILALRDQVAPPTANLDNPEENYHGFNLVPHKPQQITIHHALSNSFGFGGTNASLIFSRLSQTNPL